MSPAPLESAYSAIFRKEIEVLQNTMQTSAIFQSNHHDIVRITCMASTDYMVVDPLSLPK